MTNEDFFYRGDPYLGRPAGFEKRARIIAAVGTRLRSRHVNPSEPYRGRHDTARIVIVGGDDDAAAAQRRAESRFVADRAAREFRLLCSRAGFAGGETTLLHGFSDFVFLLPSGRDAGDPRPTRSPNARSRNDTIRSFVADKECRRWVRFFIGVLKRKNA